MTEALNKMHEEYRDHSGSYKSAVDLKFRGAITIITLNTLALTGSAIQATRRKCITPYLLIFLTSAISIAQAAASDALAMISMIFLWVYLLDVFRFSQPIHESHRREKLYGTYLGYMWAAVGMACTIAFASNIHYQMDPYQVTYIPQIDERGGLFAVHGVWGFCIFLAYEFHFCKNNIKPFRRTLVIFASFVLLSAIGSSVSAYLIALEYSIGQADISGKSYQIEAIGFALHRLPSALGLIWATMFSHMWGSTNIAPAEKRDLEDQSSLPNHRMNLSSVSDPGISRGEGVSRSIRF
ncbi:hypothetical protein BX666DRAFT_2027788 [Dichotomocladium elegans]|nr:hypothetical protein BX666DRAFT_2027788 [Dichotomocladium elegans]